MMLHRGGNDDSVHVGAVEKLLRLCDALDVRIKRANMFQALRIKVADGFELAVRNAFEVANQQWSPVTASDYAYCDWFFHSFEIIPIRRAKLAWRLKDLLQLAAPVLWSGAGLAPDDFVGPPSWIPTGSQR